MAGAGARFSFPMVIFDSNCGSEFINHDVAAWLQTRDIAQTRSRPYQKNVRPVAGRGRVRWVVQLETSAPVEGVTLSVAEVGNVRLPVGAPQERQLVSVGRRAMLGLGKQTLVARTVGAERGGPCQGSQTDRSWAKTT